MTRIFVNVILRYFRVASYSEGYDPPIRYGLLGGWPEIGYGFLTPEAAPRAHPQFAPTCEGLQREVRDWEPHVPLFAGETGFDVYDRIVADALRVLRRGGWLILELGFGSREHVAGLLRKWKDLRIEPDLAGIPRVVAARRPAQ